MKRIFWILLSVAAVVIAVAWFSHRAKLRALNSGAVYVRDQSGKKTALPASATASGNQPAQPAAVNPAQPESSSANQAPAPAQTLQLVPPSADSIRRTPPNGMVFAGSGKFQLYRQGDITWRVNTDTGDACILFATMEQWHKTLVYNHGCGSA